MLNDWDLKKIITVVLIALIVGKIFGPVGLAVMALIYLCKYGPNKDQKP